MTQYYYAPAVGELGGAPSGWTLRGDGGSTVAVVDLGGGVYAARFQAASATVDGYAWRSNGNPAEFADGETYARVRFLVGDGTRPSKLSTVMRWNSATGGSALGTFYGTRTAIGATGTDQLSVREYCQSAASEVINTDTANSPISSALNIDIHVLVKCAGTTISWKCWREGDSEPSYQSTTDSTITASGETGIHFQQASDFYLLRFGVGTGADSAPRSAGASATSEPPRRRAFPFSILHH